MISPVRGVFRPVWAILATVLKETKVRESTHIAYWTPGIERLYTSWKGKSFLSFQSNQMELKRHFDRICPGWLQFPPQLLRDSSLVKHIGGNMLTSSSMFASAGSLIRSGFKTLAASMHFAARNHGFELTAHSRVRRLYTFSGISFCCV